MSVKIKLKRLGKIRAPYYRIVVADARTKRDGRAIEEIGKYHPKADPSFIEVNSERAQHWLSVGAQPTDPVRKILEITGDWQKFKGLPGAEGTLKTAAPKADRKEIFAAAVKETLGDAPAATKARGKSSSAKDADAGEKSGKADKAEKDAGSGRGGRQARAKSGDQSGKAAKSGGDAAAKAAEDTAAKPAAKAAEDTAAKAAEDTAAKVKSEGAGDAAAAEAPAAEAPAAEAPAAEAPAGDTAEAKAEPAAADAESASGD